MLNSHAERGNDQVEQARPSAKECHFPLPTLTCGHVLRGRLCTFIFWVSAGLSWARWRCWPKSWAITSPAPTPTSIHR
ncbi:hypothetical protein EGJ55_08565 [Pseudomonas moraviensis]|nr:hypothetical protein EGJ55_08565 [Pseudomonas moraviensis]